MAVDVKPFVVKESSVVFPISAIIVRGVWKDSDAYIPTPYCNEILERFPDFAFNNQEYDIRNLNPSQTVRFDPKEAIRVREIWYQGNSPDGVIGLCTKEYLELGRPKRIMVDISSRITSADQPP